MSEQVKWCTRCFKKYLGSTCDNCGSYFFTLVEPDSKIKKVKQPGIEVYKPGGIVKSKAVAIEENLTTEQLLHQLIQVTIKNTKAINETTLASNRTTHAVRAFVLFLFIQLTTTTFAFFLYSIAEQVGFDRGESPDSGLVAGAVLVWFAGVGFSSYVGWSEIEKSTIG